MPLGTRDILLMIRARDQASRIISDVGRTFGTVGTEAGRTGRHMQQTGQTIAGIGIAITAVGAAGLAFFASATRAAMEYDKASRLTLTQIDKQKASLEDIKRIGRDVAMAIPAPFEQMQASLFDIFSSMDVGIGEAEKMLKGFSMAAVAGNVDIQIAGRATIAIMNAWKDEGMDLNRALDVQFQIVRKGVIDYQQLASTIGRAIPSAVRAGQSIETLGGMIAFMTRNGMSAAQATTSAARALDLLSNPVFGQRMQKLGIDVLDAAGNFRPMENVMVDLRHKLMDLPLGERSAALKELTKGAGGVIQAMRFMNLAVSDSSGSFQELTQSMLDANGVLKEGYDIMRQTPEAQVQLLKNAFAVLKTEIGEGLLPMVGKLAAAGYKLIEWFRGLDEDTKKNIIRIALWSSVALTVIGVLTTLGGAVLIVMGVWKQLNAAMAITTSLQLAKNFFPLMILGLQGLAANAMHGVRSLPLLWGAIRAGAASMTTAQMAAMGLSLALKTIGIGLVIGAVVWVVEKIRDAVAKTRATYAEFASDIVTKSGSGGVAIDNLDAAIRKQEKSIDALRKEYTVFGIDLSFLSGKMLHEKAAIEELNKARSEQERLLKESGIKDAILSITESLGAEAAAAFQAAAANEEAFGVMADAAAKMGEAVSGALAETLSVLNKFADESNLSLEEARAGFEKELENTKIWAAALKQLYAAGFTEIGDEIFAAGPAAAEKARLYAEGIKTGATGEIEALRQNIQDEVDGVVVDVVTKTPAALAAGEGFGSGMGIRAYNGLRGWRGPISAAGDDVVNDVRGKAGAAGEAGRIVGNAMGSNEVSGLSPWRGPLNAIAGSMVAGAASNASAEGSSGGRRAGDSMGSGMNSGLSGWRGRLLSTAINIAAAAWRAAMDFIQGKSPSRLWMKVGDSMGSGAVLGLKAQAKNMERAARDFLDFDLNNPEHTGLGHSSLIPAPAQKALDKALSRGDEGRSNAGELRGGDTYNFHGRLETPDEIWAKINFEKLTRGR